MRYIEIKASEILEYMIKYPSDTVLKNAERVLADCRTPGGVPIMSNGTDIAELLEDDTDIMECITECFCEHMERELGVPFDMWESIREQFDIDFTTVTYDMWVTMYKLNLLELFSMTAVNIQYGVDDRGELDRERENLELLVRNLLFRREK